MHRFAGKMQHAKISFLCFAWLGYLAPASKVRNSPSEPSRVHLRASFVQDKARNVETGNASIGPALPVHLMVVADQCKCQFSGLCTCGAAIDFMNCIAAACQSGACHCEIEEHWMQTCDAMVKTCPKAGLQCSKDSATCAHQPLPSDQSVDEIKEELRTLKGQKCNLEAAKQAGYINAESQLRQVEVVIQGHLDLLKHHDVPAVFMGCGPVPAGIQGKDYEVSYVGGEETVPIGTPAPAAVIVVTMAPQKQKEVISEPAEVPVSTVEMVETKRRWEMFKNVSFHLLLILIFAFLYDRVRLRTKFVQSPKEEVEGFRNGLFSCLEDPWISLFACCCLGVRWADSVDKANTRGETFGMRFWPAVLTYVVLLAFCYYIAFVLLWPFVGAIFAIALLCVQVKYRQVLRRRYGIVEAGSLKTMMEDLFSWMCCPCCTAVQEARQVEASYYPPAPTRPADSHRSGWSSGRPVDSH